MFILSASHCPGIISRWRTRKSSRSGVECRRHDETRSFPLLCWPSLTSLHKRTGSKSQTPGMRVCVCLSASAALLNSLISVTNQAQNPLTNTTETLEQQCVCCLSDVMLRLRGRSPGRVCVCVCVCVCVLTCVCVCVQRKGGKAGYCFRVITRPPRMTLRRVFVRNWQSLSLCWIVTYWSKDMHFSCATKPQNVNIWCRLPFKRLQSIKCFLYKSMHLFSVAEASG